MNFLKNIGTEIKNGALATGGGALARLMVNNMDKVPVVGNMKMVHKPIAFLIGAAIAGSKKAHYVGIGAMAVAGTDALSDYIPMVKSIGSIEDENTLNALAEELAEELEEGVYEDVSNSQAAMNDDVSNAESAMNGV